MSNAGHVSGKVAVVTGGAHDMGAAHVRAWRAKVRSSLRPTQSTTSEPPWPSSCSRREETSLTTSTMSPAAPGGKPWWRASSRRTARSTCSSATPACRSDRWESKPTIANGTCGNEAGVHESVFGQRAESGRGHVGVRAILQVVNQFQQYERVPFLAADLEIPSTGSRFFDGNQTPNSCAGYPYGQGRTLFSRQRRRQHPNAARIRLWPTYRVGLPQARAHRLLVRYAVPAVRWSSIVDS